MNKNIWSCNMKSLTNRKQRVVMFASDFSKYGKVQAMKSTLEFLARDAGHIFVFVNDPQRGDVPKTKFGDTTVTGLLSPNEINSELSKMEDVHAS